MLRCIVPETPALLTMTCRPPNCSTRRRHQPADLVELGHVGVDEQCVCADVLGQRGTGFAVDVADEHLRTFGGEAPATGLRPGPTRRR